MYIFKFEIYGKHMNFKVLYCQTCYMLTSNISCDSDMWWPAENFISSPDINPSAWSVENESWNYEQTWHLYIGLWLQCLTEEKNKHLKQDKLWANAHLIWYPPPPKYVQCVYEACDQISDLCHQ